MLDQYRLRSRPLRRRPTRVTTPSPPVCRTMRSNSPPGPKTWYPVISATKLRPSPHTISSVPLRNSPGPSPGRPKFRTWWPEPSTTTTRLEACCPPRPSSRYNLPEASKPRPRMLENCSHSAAASIDPMRYTNSKFPNSGRSSAGNSTTSWAPTPVAPKGPPNAMAIHIPPNSTDSIFPMASPPPPVGQVPVHDRADPTIAEQDASTQGR